ncbi:MAG TPA: endolytic transglycosylase MltG [Bacteroidales bacterium]|nr:endolytic transglycosylase MltG [Bacteroidales bacterium]
MKRKKLIIIFSIAFALGAVGGGVIAALFLLPNVTVQSEKGEEFLLVYENTDMEEFITQISEDVQIKNISTFKLTSKLLKFNSVRSGRYRITDGMNNLDLVRMLRNGNQTPVKLTFNNIRTKEQLAGRLSRQLMPDSVTILNLLNDTAFLEQYGLNPYTSVSLFLPDTYEVFWNISAEKLFERMNKEYQRFWTKERKQKAAAIPLTQEEVSTLASIVDAETNTKAEKPIVAGLYINRLRKNMPLQADPTVIFGLGDFSIRRVLSVHTRSDSPYNTYKNTGLPPGPIRIPSIAGLDAVLNYDKNDYIYMCAKETFNGEHNFATSWAEHQKNAAKYQRALNERGIK